MPDRKTYEERLSRCENPLLKKLFQIIIDKKTNLCVAANFETLEELVRFVDVAGPHICILKTQLFGLRMDLILPILYEKKKQYNFLLFEDPKFVDCQKTTERFYERIYAKYVDLVTVVGKGAIKAIEQASIHQSEPRGCLVLCETSYDPDLIPDPKKALKIAESYPNICIGIIAQQLQVTNDCAMIKASPGVHLSQKTDNKDQNWRDPSVVIGDGADVIIVGRGITETPQDDWEKITLQYKEAGWKAYCESVKVPN